MSEGGKSEWDAGESRLIASFAALQLVPLLDDGLRGVRDSVGEDVWMATNELVGDAVDDVPQGKLAALLRDLHMKQDLQKQVAQLLAKMRWIRLVIYGI